MREALGGLPESIDTVAVHAPFHNALMTHRNRSGGRHAFTLAYKSGEDTVLRFNAHLAVCGEHKNVTIQCDAPYIESLPIKMVLEQKGEGGRDHREGDRKYLVMIMRVWRR